MRYVWILGVWSCVDLCAERPADDNLDIPIDSSLIDTGSSEPIPDVKAEHVVVIVLDGARIEETFGTDRFNYSDAAEESIPTSELFVSFKEQVLPQGALIRPGYNTGITITGPGHCSILTGIRQNFGQFSTPADPGWYRPELPTVYEAVRKVFPDSVMKVGGNTDHVHAMDHSVYPGVTSDDGAVYDFVSEDDDPEKPNDADEAVLTWMQEQLSSSAPPMVMLGNMHSMDRAGHYNSSDWAYGERVEQMGDPIVDFWNWIQSDASGVKDKTLMIVVADHGRHRWGDEEAERLEGDERYDQDFRTHGDQCRGCRELPMFLVGPGIKAGVDTDVPYSLEDIGRTIAYAVGADFPTADGMVIADAFTTPPPAGTDRSGEVRVAVGGDSVATQMYSDDPAHRSSIVLDGETVSSSAAGLAEEPTVVNTEMGTFACWRELTLDIDSDAIDWPWVARCMRKSGTAWTDIGFPVDEVWPLFTTSMVADGDELVVAFADNSNATTYSETRGGVRLARWNDNTGWQLAENFNGELYPNNPVVTMHDGGAFVAYAASDVEGDSTDPGRYTRHVEVHRIDWSSAEPEFVEIYRTYADGCPEEAKCPTYDPTVDAEGYTYGRMEAATLADLGEGLGLAFIGYSDQVGNTILVSAGSDSGDVWEAPRRVDTTGRVFGHINPVWIGDLLVWARLSEDDTVEVCRAVRQGEPDCIDTGYPRIMGLNTDGTTVMASLDHGNAEWVSEVIEWP